VKYKLYSPVFLFAFIAILFLVSTVSLIFAFLNKEVFSAVVALLLYIMGAVFLIHTLRSNAFVLEDCVVFGKNRFYYRDMLKVELKPFAINDFGFEFIDKKGKTQKVSAGMLCSKKQCEILKEILEKRIQRSL